MTPSFEENKNGFSIPKDYDPATMNNSEFVDAGNAP